DLLDGGVDESVAARILSAEIRPAELSEPLAAWREARDTIASNFADERRDELKNDLMTTVDDARQLLDLLAETVGDIEEWLDYAETRRRLSELGLSEHLEFCESEWVERELVPKIVERAVLERWADCVLASDGG